MAVYEVTVRSGSSSRNLATTNDPFSFLFGETPEEDDADSDDDSSSVTNPLLFCKHALRCPLPAPRGPGPSLLSKASINA